MRLVVGATGLLGGEICRRLAEAGESVRALVRETSDPAKVEALKSQGVETVVGDLKDRASVDAACQGVSTVISTASATLSQQPGDSLDTVDMDGQLGLVDAAKAAGVEHMIYVSFRHGANPGIEYPLKNAKKAVEERLIASGMSYTILQAGYFMEVWLSPALGFDYANSSARIYGPGENALSWVMSSDVAKFAGASVRNPAARNRVVEVGGPEALSPLEAVRVFEDVIGRKFAVEHVPLEALEAQKEGATNPLEETFAALMLNYAAGDAMDMDEAAKEFGVELTSVRNYANSVT